jgi:uncharacterized OsmC-like protein
MNLIGPDQKAAVEKSIRELGAATEPSGYLGYNKATATLVENQHSTGSVRGFTLVQDEPPSVGGGKRGPTPTDYFAFALGSCENVVFVRYAALNDVEVESLETTVTGVWDRRGLYGLNEVDPRFTEIMIETRIVTASPKERVVMVARLTHRGCPIYATLSRATKLVFALVVNGENVPL